MSLSKRKKLCYATEVCILPPTEFAKGDKSDMFVTPVHIGEYYSTQLRFSHCLLHEHHEHNIHFHDVAQLSVLKAHIYSTGSVIHLHHV